MQLDGWSECEYKQFYNRNERLTRKINIGCYKQGSIIYICLVCYLWTESYFERCERKLFIGSRNQKSLYNETGKKWLNIGAKIKYL